MKSTYNYQADSGGYRSSTPVRSRSLSPAISDHLSTDISERYKRDPNSAAYTGNSGRCSRTSHTDYYSHGPSSSSSRGRSIRNEPPTYKVGPPQLWNKSPSRSSSIPSSSSSSPSSSSAFSSSLPLHNSLSRAAQERTLVREGQNALAHRTRSWGEHTTPMSRFHASNTFPVPGTPPRSNPFV